MLLIASHANKESFSKSTSTSRDADCSGEKSCSQFPLSEIIICPLSTGSIRSKENQRMVCPRHWLRLCHDAGSVSNV